MMCLAHVTRQFWRKLTVLILIQSSQLIWETLRKIKVSVQKECITMWEFKYDVPSIKEDYNHLFPKWIKIRRKKKNEQRNENGKCSKMKWELPITCNDDIKGVQDIWGLFRFPMQYHGLHFCFTKNSSIGLYITLNIWMLRMYCQNSKESNEG